MPAVLHNQNDLEIAVPTLCNINDAADEFHVIWKYSLFQEECLKLLGKRIFTPANMF